MFFGHTLFSNTPIFHWSNYFLVSENIGYNGSNGTECVNVKTVIATQAL